MSSAISSATTAISRASMARTDEKEDVLCHVVSRAKAGKWTQDSKLWSVNDLQVEAFNDKEAVVIFVPDGELGPPVPCQQRLSEKFGIPKDFWCATEQKASGFTGCEERTDDEGKMIGHDASFRFLIKDTPDKATGEVLNKSIKYFWHKIGVFSRWRTPQDGADPAVAICFIDHDEFRVMMTEYLVESDGKFYRSDPFAFHGLFLNQIIKLLDAALWHFRDFVRQIEKRRIESDVRNAKENLAALNVNFDALHEINRHINHSAEVIETAVETAAAMMSEHRIFFQEHTDLGEAAVSASRQVGKQMRHAKSLLKCIELRSKSLEERLRKEFNHIYYVLTQVDSKISLELGKLAVQDSAAMRTVSTLGLLFLPINLICEIFSTAFFNLTGGSGGDPLTFVVSDNFWIFWVFAIPLTMATSGYWYFWQRRYTRENQVLVRRNTTFFSKKSPPPRFSEKRSPV